MCFSFYFSGLGGGEKRAIFMISNMFEKKNEYLVVVFGCLRVK
jgi:hypothetical protein